MNKLLCTLLDTVRCIDDEWRKLDYSCQAFPDLVWELTNDLDLRPFGDLKALAELIDEPTVRYLQVPSSFSDLHINLFDNGRFLVEVLNWWGSDINIHDHDFSGVQYQLAGSSLNVVYSFQGEENEARFALGNLDVARTEYWRPGDRSIVRPGRAEPHNVNHIDRPTVSLLIRTSPLQSYGPQRNYFPPSVAANYGVADAALRKKIKALRLQASNFPNEFPPMFRSITAKMSDTELLFTLVKMVDILFLPQFVSLVNELGKSQRNCEMAEMIRCVSYYRANDYLINTVKWMPHLSTSHRIAISALASVYDIDSFQAVTTYVKQETGIDVSQNINEVMQLLSENHSQQICNILRLLDLQSVVDYDQTFLRTQDVSK